MAAAKKKTPGWGSCSWRCPSPGRGWARRAAALRADRAHPAGFGVDGRPTINGWAVPSCDVGPGSYDHEGARVTGTIAVELLEGHAYLVFARSRRRRSASSPSQGNGSSSATTGNNSDDARDFGGVRTIRGRPRREEELHVPPALLGALKSCLDKQPPRDKTVPPPPAR